MSGPSVVVAVPTFRRAGQLGGLLTDLVGQIDDLGRAEIAGRTQILVIDNDPDESARPVVQQLVERMAEQVAGNAGERVRYVVESRPGVVAVRNRALDETPDWDLCVFIDDDERPVPGWLRLLVTGYLATGAPGVAGPVRSVLPADVDPWIVAGGFFERRHRHGLASGAPISEAATNNLLLDLSVVRRFGLRFDPRFALSGGEDSMFTRQLSAVAGPLRWCADAQVSEDVPAERLSRSWVRRRALSLANSESLVRLALAGGPAGRASLRIMGMLRGLARILAGLGGMVAGVASRSVARRARSSRTCCRGVGLLAGAFGLVYQEYGRGASRWVRSGQSNAIR